jgi:hypothetical protein
LGVKKCNPENEKRGYAEKTAYPLDANFMDLSQTIILQE